MSRKYKFHDPNEVYFVTFTVVNWIDLFTRDDYRMVLIDSIRYCQENKGLEVYAWVIMTNHVHLIVSATVPARLDEIVRDLKRHTSGKLRKAIRENPQESRKSWITWMLEKEGTFNNNNIDWQLWQQHNHPIQLSTMEMARQRLNYLHENPVRAGFVSQADHWRWGSAFDYNGGKGPIDILYLF